MQKTERSDQDFFEETREKDNIGLGLMQILGPEVGHLYMRPKIWGTRPLRPSCEFP